MCKLDALLFHGNRARYFKEKLVNKREESLYRRRLYIYIFNTLNAAPSSRHGIRDSVLLFHSSICMMALNIGSFLLWCLPEIRLFIRCVNTESSCMYLIVPMRRMCHQKASIPNAFFAINSLVITHRARIIYRLKLTRRWSTKKSADVYSYGYSMYGD